MYSFFRDLPQLTQSFQLFLSPRIILFVDSARLSLAIVKKRDVWYDIVQLLSYEIMCNMRHSAQHWWGNHITSTDHYVFHIPSISTFLSQTFISRCLHNHMTSNLRKLVFVGRSCAKWTKDGLILIYVNDQNKLWIKIVLTISLVW